VINGFVNANESGDNCLRISMDILRMCVDYIVSNAISNSKIVTNSKT